MKRHPFRGIALSLALAIVVIGVSAWPNTATPDSDPGRLPSPVRVDEDALRSADLSGMAPAEHDDVAGELVAASIDNDHHHNGTSSAVLTIKHGTRANAHDVAHALIDALDDAEHDAGAGRHHFTDSPGFGNFRTDD